MSSLKGRLSADAKTADGEEGMHIKEENSNDKDEEKNTRGEKERHIARSPHSESVNGFKDESELAIQLHQTLADVETRLADHTLTVSANVSSNTNSTESSDVPVSVVDMDVPVTAIDEVLEEFEFLVEHEVKPLTETESVGRNDPISSHHSDEQQNKNNRAYTAALGYKTTTASSKLSEESSTLQEIKSTSNKKEKRAKEKKIKEKKRIADSTTVREDTQTMAVKSSADLQKTSKPAVITADLAQQSPQSLKQKKSELPAKIQRSVSPGKDEAIHKANQISSSFSPMHGKITHSVTSRFGMKTFTVVPPKPSVTNVTKTEPTQPGGGFAIKIDDQGNMVARGIPHQKSREKPKPETENGISARENAKALISSNKRKENLVTERKEQVDKPEESTEAPGCPSDVGLEGILKTSNTENQKTTPSAAFKPAVTVVTKVGVKEDHKPVIKDFSPTRGFPEVGSKISVPNNDQRPSNKPSVPLPLHPDRNPQMNFVKPFRRTSSQYVASAISKYTPQTSAKPSSAPQISQSPDSLKTEKDAGCKKSVTQFQSSQVSSLNIMENDSSSTITAPFPKRSMSFPEYMSDTTRKSSQVKIFRERFEKESVAKKDGLDTDKETPKANSSQYNGSPQIQIISSSRGDHNHIQPLTPSPAKGSAPHSSFKPPVAPKTKPQHQGAKDALKEVKLQTPTTEPDGGETPGSEAGVTVFGPVKKFKPVTCKSVEKETSLHSSLMVAIQTGGGKERLKKISTTASNENKVEYVEEVNERSALLAGLKSQNISRLKKTKSKAAKEVDRFRQESSREEKTMELSPSPPSLTRSTPDVPLPPPPPPMSAPPASPPPAFSQAKPHPVAHANANVPLNPALARDALLEAIRSGSGAEKLRKVPAPKKILQVNGRLGTIHPTSSRIFQH